jgi:hypothetical protein
MRSLTLITAGTLFGAPVSLDRTDRISKKSTARGVAGSNDNGNPDICGKWTLPAFLPGKGHIETAIVDRCGRMRTCYLFCRAAPAGTDNNLLEPVLRWPEHPANHHHPSFEDQAGAMITPRAIIQSQEREYAGSIDLICGQVDLQPLPS